MSQSAETRFRDRTVFVTGGAGFIGSALIRHLLDDTQARVVNIDKLTYAANLASIPQAPGHNRYRFEQIDICDRAAIAGAFARHRPDAVFNLAAESHVDRSIEGPDDFIQTNVVGAFTMLQAALAHWRTLPEPRRRDFRFIQISTDEVYGSLGPSGLFTETSAYAPNSPYSASKAAADHLARAWRETYGLPTIVTNCSNNFGPYHFPEKLIPHIVIRGLAGETLPVYGDGGNIRDWLYVEDHARALSLVLERGVPGECYNIGARAERRNIDVVSAICDLLDAVRPHAKGARRALIAFVPDRPGHDRRYAIDPSKIERELGWRPAHSFEDALARTVRWYCENEGWWRAILERGYRTERLGLVKEAAK